MSLVQRALLRQIRHVHPDVHDARTAAARRQIQRDLGLLVPPFALHLPVPDALAAYWAIYREATWGNRTARAQKEAVAAVVSATNTCPFCVDIHTTVLHGLGDPALASAIAETTEAIADSDLRALVSWARATRQPDAPVLRQRPFPDQHAPELLGVAVTYHYVNRMVNIFTKGSPFPEVAPRFKVTLRRIAAPAVRRGLGGLTRQPARGGSADLLPPAPLPHDLGWARADPVIADAFARAAAAFDAVGRQALPDPVRQLVAARLDAWRGEDPGLSRGWVEHAIQPLPVAQRPLGRLALLAALASYQVDEDVIQDARPGPAPAGDDLLIAATAWASFTAARRIGSWLHTLPATATTPRADAPARGLGADGTGRPPGHGSLLLAGRRPGNSAWLACEDPSRSTR